MQRDADKCKILSIQQNKIKKTTKIKKEKKQSLVPSLLQTISYYNSQCEDRLKVS